MARPSVIKTVKISDRLTVDIIKTTHFMDRFNTRNFNFDDVVTLAEKTIEKALKTWLSRKMNHTQGVLQQDSLNVMFGIHYNAQTKHIDFELTSAMEKVNFFTNNIPDAVVIRISKEA